MITSLFKNTIIGYFLILFISVGLWGFSFLETDKEMMVSLNFAGESYEISKRIAIVISFFSTLISGFFLNNRLNKNLFSYDPNNLFLLFYMMIFSVELSNSSFLVYDIVSFLLIIFVYYLLSFITSKNDKNQVFNSAFLIGVLCFQNLFFIAFILLLIQNLSTTRRVGFSELTLILTGFLIPILLVLSLSFLTENYQLISALWQLEFKTPVVTWQFIVFVSISSVFSFLGFQLAANKRSGTDINTLMLINNLIVYFLVSLVVGIGSLFVFPQYYVVFLFTLPVSIFLSFYVLESSSRWKELAFLALLALTFLLR
ncbi:MAG: DUF6427 family protein [Flavobacteriales bacterium]|jgi:hypothetical protein